MNPAIQAKLDEARAQLDNKPARGVLRGPQHGSTDEAVAKTIEAVGILAATKGTLNKAALDEFSSHVSLATAQEAVGDPKALLSVIAALQVLAANLPNLISE